MLLEVHQCRETRPPPPSSPAAAATPGGGRRTRRRASGVHPDPAASAGRLVWLLVRQPATTAGRKASTYASGTARHDTAGAPDGGGPTEALGKLVSGAPPCEHLASRTDLPAGGAAVQRSAAHTSAHPPDPRRRRVSPRCGAAAAAPLLDSSWASSQGVFSHRYSFLAFCGRTVRRIRPAGRRLASALIALSIS